jgi:hypothetical protein
VQHLLDFDNESNASSHCARFQPLCTIPAIVHHSTEVIARRAAVSLDSADFSHNVAVEAYVVTIRGAARPDKEGLLQPLLRRWQQGRCNEKIFTLPAVQVRCWFLA